MALFDPLRQGLDAFKRAQLQGMLAGLKGAAAGVAAGSARAAGNACCKQATRSTSRLGTIRARKTGACWMLR